MKITVVGLGYVGVANAVLFAQNNEVIAIDIDSEKVDMINNRLCPVKDIDIKEYFKEKKLSLLATTDETVAYKNADYIIICTPTDYIAKKRGLEISSIESVINGVLCVNQKANIIIKSTIPIGYTRFLYDKYGDINILFSPEFLREGKAINDNLHPSRIVVGIPKKTDGLIHAAESYMKLVVERAIRKDAPQLLMSSNEAEAVKLFANSYLAMRINFFNELDSFAETSGLDARSIIEGLCFDDRIGNYYNNPSFGYGGYCLPKDTRQLSLSYNNVPKKQIDAVDCSNRARQKFIKDRIMLVVKAQIKKKLSKGDNKGVVLGVYRLIMKRGSDNFRQSSILHIIKSLSHKKIKIIIYEPILKEKKEFKKFSVINSLDLFKSSSDIIVANRYDDEIKDVSEKVYSRDIYFRD